jgi:hypothetical protein
MQLTKIHFIADSHVNLFNRLAAACALAKLKLTRRRIIPAEQETLRLVSAGACGHFQIKDREGVMFVWTAGEDRGTAGIVHQSEILPLDYPSKMLPPCPARLHFWCRLTLSESIKRSTQRGAAVSPLAVHYL